MPINLKKLLAVGRRKLGLQGKVEFRKSKGSQNILATSSTSLANHIISYSDASGLSSIDVFHELCRARLQELGFKSAETAALTAIRDCCKDDPKYIFDANSAAVIVSEVYSNWLLFNHFEESETQREEIISRFQSTDALTSLYTRMGFWGIGGVAYYRVSSEWAGKEFPWGQVEKALKRAPEAQKILQEFEKVWSLLRELPKPKNEEFTESEQIQLVSVIVKLFSAKTGIEC